MPANSSPYNIVLYGSGLFGRNITAVNTVQLAELQKSGFTTVILWTLHLDDDGSLVYNDTVIIKDGVFAATFSHLPGLLNELLAAGSVQQILFCIGSWGPNDFTAIGKLLATPAGKLTLIRNFSALSSALPITGYDFDDEESSIDPNVIAPLAEILCAGGKMTVTYCPYGNQAQWNLGIEQTWTWAQQQTPPLAQPVRWWNLQCYAGGGSNDPAVWVSNLSNNAGISNTAAYIVPGYDAGGMIPSDVQKQFATLFASDSGIAGGFIWNSEEIFAGSYSLADYASAVANGLAGIP